MGYDRVTDDEKKAVQVFVLGKDMSFNKQERLSITRPWVFTNQTRNSNSMASYPTTVGEYSSSKQ